MDDGDPRSVLDRLIRERGEDYASISRLIGRNPAYIQQFIRRGSPRKLDEEDRRLLADFFRVPESSLGGREGAMPAPAGRPVDPVVRIPRLDVRASAGPGAITGEEEAAGVNFDSDWLRSFAPGGAAALSVIRVEGDSMEPTLADGDEILVDAKAVRERLRDGIYVLRRDDTLLVKRVAVSPVTGRLAVISDNRAYRTDKDVDPATITIVGRVIWFGRRVR